MISTPETRKIAQGILDYWERFPQRHNQSAWFGVIDEDGDLIDVDGADGDVDKIIDAVFAADTNVCGTTMCAAGTAVFLATDPKEFRQSVKEESIDWQREGARLLGLTEDEACRVFYMDNDTVKHVMRALADGDHEEFNSWV